MRITERRTRGQSLVIVALSATALFGIIALGLDAGRLYFERRDVQNAADAGALAGAQELIPKTPNVGVSSDMSQSARYLAALYAFKTWGDTPRDGPGSPAYLVSPGTPITEYASQVLARAIITTPSRSNPNEISVEVVFDVPMTFASVLGFTSTPVDAIAYAHGGFLNRTYTVFGFAATGSGNSVNDDQNGWGQIDNGNNGLDCGNPSTAQGRLVSNAKWHTPNPTRPGINLNGAFDYAQASDTHAVLLYWAFPVSPTLISPEPVPNYEPPQRPAYSGYWQNIQRDGRWWHIFHPGTYTTNVSIPFGTDQGGQDLYIFQNGIYYFDGVSLTITGGTVSNTQSGGPVYSSVGGVSDLPPDPATGMNGVEFVFDGNAAFSASTSSNPNVFGPRVFFVAPSVVPSGITDSIAFFITSTDSISGPQGVVWSETIDGTQTQKNPFFQVYGTIFDADQNGSHGTQVQVQAVSQSTYAVTGELVASQVDLDNGGLANPTPTTVTCPPYQANPAGLLVQYNSSYAPHFRGLSYLVK